MEKEEFKKIVNYTEELKKEYKEISCRAGALIGIVKTCEDLTRKEILKLMEILFL